MDSNDLYFEQQSNNDIITKFYFDKDNLKDDFSYLKPFIFNFPLFNIKKQPNADLNKIFSPINQTQNDNDSITFNDPEELFDFVCQNSNFKIFFIDAIKNIILTFNEILYVRPYSILFGRIHIEKNETKNNTKIVDFPFRKEINEEFYRGFEIE